MFSVDSNHMALIMPKEHASKTPNIHAKYHIALSLINGVRLVKIIVFNATAHYVEAISRVAKYDRYKDAGNDEHNVQCHMTRRSVPYCKAGFWHCDAWH